MALLLRSPSWRRCLVGAAAGQRQQLCSTALALKEDNPFERIQDPSQTRAAYSGAEKGDVRKPPGPGDDGVEREVKWGANMPASAGQAKEELKTAGKGLAESVEQGVNVLLSKAKDTMAAAERAVGMDPGRPEMSQGTMGAAGKMEHAPPGTKQGWNSGPVSEDLARAKYDEIAGTEKPHFPAGEQSVKELFPEMNVAAKEQSNTPDRQREENERLRAELHRSKPGHAERGSASGANDMAQDTLNENLHNRGP